MSIITKLKEVHVPNRRHAQRSQQELLHAIRHVDGNEYFTPKGQVKKAYLENMLDELCLKYDIPADDRVQYTSYIQASVMRNADLLKSATQVDYLDALSSNADEYIKKLPVKGTLFDIFNNAKELIYKVPHIGKYYVKKEAGPAMRAITLAVLEVLSFVPKLGERIDSLPIYRSMAEDVILDDAFKLAHPTAKIGFSPIYFFQTQVYEPLRQTNPQRKS